MPAENTPTTSGERPRVVILTGPTASGKTGLALELAQQFGGEIVNADSMQVFRFMDIGTAKPSLEERATVAHHMVDVVDPDVPFSAGRYAREARRAIESIHARGSSIWLTGGTGLYIRAVTEGLIGGVDPDPALREKLELEHQKAVEQNDPHRLHRQLVEEDEAAAAKIHPNDTRRVIRALEIRHTSGQRTSELRDNHAFGEALYETLHLAIDPGRERLAKRIDQRCQTMVEQGLLQEVRNLRDRFGAHVRPMQAIGYRHMNVVADGQCTLDQALASMQRDTRHFARRQRTWLRALDNVHRHTPDDVPGIQELVVRFLETP
ncbi:tRNA (adenosine(37)-N6)-dimethylallyltransferase MiaA [Myxococcota bacterium]|nr:tRNA (adenosine(37)-N6)-dimethylallyltransferase MiaA [Myxococcota bacterium]